MRLRHLLAAALVTASVAAFPSGFKTKPLKTRLSMVGNGWSGTSVNTAVFRTNSVASRGNVQYVAYYDADGFLTLAKRRMGTDKWTVQRSQYKGNVKDGHNVICIGIDGDGCLHVAFDHHGHPLRYARTIAPGSLTLGALEPMTGIDEKNVTYPEFYTLADGDLLFVYRSGASGRGNMAMNRYDRLTKRWLRVQDSLIDGENKRSPYWQVYVDGKGVIHVSWVWRETWLVETNHDLCYARSTDGGKTWTRSDGTPYDLPITASNAEYAWRIPQKSELINQTSMTADAESRPYIVTYWRDSASTVPQYRLVWHDGGKWDSRVISQRTTPFSLSGGGTKMIPISRPRIVADGKNVGVIFRDVERGSRVSYAYSTTGCNGEWQTVDLTGFPVGAWEPSFDTELWRSKQRLDIFVQQTSQGDGERTVDAAPTPVYILEVR